MRSAVQKRSRSVTVIRTQREENYRRGCKIQTGTQSRARRRQREKKVKRGDISSGKVA